jgi:hypothetical protein
LVNVFNPLAGWHLPHIIKGAFMPARSIPHSLSIVISILLILSLFAAIWANPGTGITLGIIFLLFVLSAITYTIVRKNRAAYLQGQISISVSIRNICLEIAIVLLTMVLAGLAGRYLSGIAAKLIRNYPTNLIAGICVGLLAGSAMGLLVKQVSSRFVDQN